MARITNHARKRFKQRLGVHKTDTNKNAERVLREGLAQKDVRGDISRFMAALYFRNRRCNNIRLYKGDVFIFAGSTLVTVFPIPQRFQQEAKKYQEIKERNNEDGSGIAGEECKAAKD